MGAGRGTGPAHVIPLPLPHVCSPFQLLGAALGEGGEIDRLSSRARMLKSNEGQRAADTCIPSHWGAGGADDASAGATAAFSAVGGGTGGDVTPSGSARPACPIRHPWPNWHGRTPSSSCENRHRSVNLHCPARWKQQRFARSHCFWESRDPPTKGRRGLKGIIMGATPPPWGGTPPYGG